MALSYPEDEIEGNTLTAQSASIGTTRDTKDQPGGGTRHGPDTDRSSRGTTDLDWAGTTSVLAPHSTINRCISGPPQGRTLAFDCGRISVNGAS
jgi:hypothetical protein